MRTQLVLLTMAASAAMAQPYDLLLKGGHVLDPKNGINARMDVAVAAGKIAKVAANIAPAEAKRIANVDGLYVTPGLIDIHVHVYAGTGMKGVLTGDTSVYPDPLSFRSGTTTMVDCGSSGWRNFEDFKQRVIDRARTRVLAFINVVGEGMGPKGENDPKEMNAEACAALAKKYPKTVVGFKTAHYDGPGWPSIDAVTKAGRLADMPAMIDFGVINKERNLEILFRDKLRAGDIYTHCFSGNRDEVVDGKLNPAMVAARKKGIFFDVGHGGGSFYFDVASAAMKAGFKPDSISSDLHTGSMNSGFKDMPNLMSKMMALGMTLEEVVRACTWNPAQQVKHPELGHLTVGAEADVTVLKLEKGSFGFLDSAGARREGAQRLTAEMTIRAGRIEWDLNGRAAPDWRTFQYKKNQYKK